MLKLLHNISVVLEQIVTFKASVMAGLTVHPKRMGLIAGMCGLTLEMNHFGPKGEIPTVSITLTREKLRERSTVSLMANNMICVC